MGSRRPLVATLSRINTKIYRVFPQQHNITHKVSWKSPENFSHNPVHGQTKIQTDGWILSKNYLLGRGNYGRFLPPRNYQHTHVNDSRNQTCSSHQLVKHTITPQQSNISVKLCFATGMHAFIISKLQWPLYAMDNYVPSQITAKFSAFHCLTLTG